MGINHFAKVNEMILQVETMQFLGAGNPSVLWEWQ